MDLEFIMKWIPVVHKIKICELTDCGIMIKLFSYQSVQNILALRYRMNYDTFDIIAPSKSLIKRTHHYIYLKYLLTYAIHARAAETMKSLLGQTVS